MITRAIVRNGLRNGLIRLDKSPNGDGIVCKIGDYWFYFGGQTAEEYDDPQKYARDVGFVVIARDIYEALEDFRAEGKGGTNWDEYCYYEAVLTGRKKNKGARWATNLLDNYESGYVSKGTISVVTDKSTEYVSGVLDAVGLSGIEGFVKNERIYKIDDICKIKLFENFREGLEKLIKRAKEMS